MTPFGEFDHPEAADDEVWQTNCHRGKYDYFDSLVYKTKRRGTVAYDKDGKALPESVYPIFIKKVEWEEHRGYPWEEHRDGRLKSFEKKEVFE